MHRFPYVSKWSARKWTSRQSLTDAQEKTVKDLNLYLFCKNATGKDEHIYSAGSANITRKLTVGDYDLFVIANAGGDLGNMTRTQAEQSARTIGGESEARNRLRASDVRQGSPLRSKRP